MIANKHKIFTGKIPLEDSDSINMSTFFYDLPSTLKRRNKYIYPAPGENIRVIPLPDLYLEANITETAGSFVYPGESSSLIFTSSDRVANRLQESESESSPPISISIIGDMDSEDVLVLFEQLLASVS